MPIEVVKTDEDGVTEATTYHDGKSKLFRVGDLTTPRLQKLKCVHLKGGGNRWYLDGMEVPHVLAESAVLKLMWGKLAHVTMTLEVELEMVDESDGQA